MGPRPQKSQLNDANARPSLVMDKSLSKAETVRFSFLQPLKFQIWLELPHTIYRDGVAISHQVE